MQEILAYYGSTGAMEQVCLDKILKFNPPLFLEPYGSFNFDFSYYLISLCIRAHS